MRAVVLWGCCVVEPTRTLSDRTFSLRALRCVATALSLVTCGLFLQSLVSTIGAEKATNSALQIKDKSEFIHWMTDDLPPAPGYFPHCVRLNKFGGALVDELAAGMKQLTSAEAAAALAADDKVIVVDTRDADDYAAGHITGALNFPLGGDGTTLRPQDGNFGIWVGTILKPTDKLLVVCTLGREMDNVHRLSRVGYENLVGVLSEGVEEWKAASLPVESYERINWVRSTLPLCLSLEIIEIWH